MDAGEEEDDDWAFLGSPEEGCVDCHDDASCVAGQPAGLAIASDVARRGEAASWRRRRRDPADRELQGSPLTPAADELVFGSGTTPPSGAAGGCGGSPLLSAPGGSTGRLGHTLSQGATVAPAFSAHNCCVIVKN